ALGSCRVTLRFGKGISRCPPHGGSERSGSSGTRGGARFQAGAETAASTKSIIMSISSAPLTTEPAELKTHIRRFQEVQASIRREVGKVIVGQQEVIEHVLISLFVGGHCLLTGLPGTAKTLLVRTMARTLGL